MTLIGCLTTLSALVLWGAVQAQAPMKRSIGEMTVRTGSPRIPVVLVEFSNLQFSEADAATAFASRLTGQATTEQVEALQGTAEQYFADQSAGRFTPQFEVIGPVRLAHEYGYYGADGQVKDERMGELMVDAIAGCGVSDWSRYDADLDGVVDALYLIYAGEGQHAKPDQSSLIWPHTSTLAERGIDSPECGGYTFNSYSCTNELLYGQVDGIGTFIHEFLHQVGLPDFYRTDGVVPAELAMGEWSIMDRGGYAEGGKRPVGLRALEKAYLGWMEPIELTAATTVSDWPSTTAGGNALKVVNKTSSLEYYLLETIDGRGWDMSCPAQGMLVTHVYYNAVAWNNNTLNNASPFRVQIIPADNDKPYLITGQNDEVYAESLKGDTYPSPTGNNELTDTSTPASTVQVGLSGLMKKPITNIAYQAEEGRISFDFMGGSTENVLTSAPQVCRTLPQAGYYTLGGIRLDAPLKGQPCLKVEAGAVRVVWQ